MSKSKSPNGHYPPGVPPGGRVLQFTDSAKEAMQKEMVNKLQPHLNELNQENAAEQSAIALVMSAAIRHHGIKELSNDPALLENCFDLSRQLAAYNLKRSHQKAHELFVEMKVKPRDLPPHIVRAAGRQGVVLAEPESADVGTPAES